MAFTFTPKITGQQATSSYTYAYLYESLWVLIQGQTVASGPMSIDLHAYSISNTSSLQETKTDYALLEVGDDATSLADMMGIIRQYLQAEWYKIGHVDDLSKDTIVSSKAITLESQYYYQDSGYVRIIPIIGGRGFKDFVPTVATSQSLTEWTFLGFGTSGHPSFIGYPHFVQYLQDPTGSDVRPYFTKTIATTGRSVCGGAIVYKSKYGGWCTYGFDIMSEDSNNEYVGELAIDTFSYSDSGNSYMPSNYTGVKSSRTINLKTIGVDILEVKALQGIKESPAVYFCYPDSRLELMRVTSVSAPVDNLRNGSDIEVSLVSIDKNYQNIR